MPKFSTIVISGIFAAGAITALSLAALQHDAGKLDRQALAQLARTRVLDPTTTGSIAYRDHTGAPLRKRSERESPRP